MLYTRAGPEVAVASTKAFVAQVTALYLLGLHLARVRATLDTSVIAENLTELQAIPEKLADVLVASQDIGQLAVTQPSSLFRND